MQQYIYNLLYRLLPEYPHSREEETKNIPSINNRIDYRTTSYNPLKLRQDIRGKEMSIEKTA